MFRKASAIENNLQFGIRAARETVGIKPMNETEFEDFYRAHSTPLWRYARRLADSATIADDVVQESFLRFLGAARRDASNPRAYLYRIATNLVYDYFRRGKRETNQTAAAEKDFEPNYEPFAPASDIGKVFDKMKTQERALLWLAYVERHQHDEIAQMLGLKSLSVRVLLFRARRKLAGLLDAQNKEVQL